MHTITTGPNRYIEIEQWILSSIIFYKFQSVNRVKLALIKLCQLWQVSFDLYMKFWDYIEWTVPRCLICTRIRVALNSDFVVCVCVCEHLNRKSNHNHLPIHLLQSIDAHLHSTVRMFSIYFMIIVSFMCHAMHEAFKWIWWMNTSRIRAQW